MASHHASLSPAPEIAFKKPPPVSLGRGRVCVVQPVNYDVVRAVIAGLVSVALQVQFLAPVGHVIGRPHDHLRLEANSGG